MYRRSENKMTELDDNTIVHDLYFEQESQLDMAKARRNAAFFVDSLNAVFAALLDHVDELIDVEHFGSAADIFKVRRALLNDKKQLYDLFLLHVPDDYSIVSHNEHRLITGSIEEKVSHSASSDLSRFVDSVGLYLEVLAMARTEAQEAFNRAMNNRGLSEWENTKITHKRNEENAKILVSLIHSMFDFLPDNINRSNIHFPINDWLKQDTLFINNHNKIQSTVMVKPPGRTGVIGF